MQTTRAFLFSLFTGSRGTPYVPSTIRMLTRSANNKAAITVPIFKGLQCKRSFADRTSTRSQELWLTPPCPWLAHHWLPTLCTESLLLSSCLGPCLISMVRTRSPTMLPPTVILPLTHHLSLCLFRFFWSWSSEKRKNNDNNRTFLDQWDKITWSHIHVTWMHRGVGTYKKN